MAKVGGMKEVKPIDADATAIANHVKAEVEAKAGKSFATYEPVSYATQVCINSACARTPHKLIYIISS
jgi:hypothetical protein